MSDFYRNLSRDALGDEDFPDDDGNVNKFIGDMDDLDAALFGLPIKKLTSSAPIAVPTTEHVPFKSTLSSAKDHKRSQGSSKLQLMAELFGDSNEQEHKLSIPPLVTTQERKIDFDLSTRPKTSPERSNIEFESLTYQPSSVEQRERRRQPVQESKGAAMDDLWSKFLKVDTPDISKGQPSSIPQDIEKKTEKYQSNITETQDMIESPNMSATSTPKRRVPPGRNPKAPLLHSNSEDTVLDSFRIRKPLDDERSKVQSSMEQFELLKPLIETMINDKLNAIDTESRKYATKVDDLETKIENLNSSMMSQEALQELEDKILVQSTKLQEIEDKINEDHTTLLEEKIAELETDLKKTVAVLENELSRGSSHMETKLASLQKQVMECRDQQINADLATTTAIQDLTRNVQSQLAAKLSATRESISQELQDTTSKIHSLESLCSKLNIKIEEHAEKWGEDQQLRISALEAKCRQLQLSQRSTGWEEDLEFRLDRTENNFESRLLSSNKQQARLGAWQEKQISDLAEFVDQRLWSLHHQLEIQRKEIISVSQRLVMQQSSMLEPCVEAENLKKQVCKLSSSQSAKDEERESRLTKLETRLSNVEHENCRLSRLADRLCGVLQMWEQRHKSASRAEAESMQSLQERYNMAVIEMRLSK